MNHPSEWTRYYDAPRGYFRYKHKGTGVVRDSLMNIGKRFKKPSAKKERARQVLQKIMEDETKQIVKKAADKVVEKEADKIQAVLRSGDTPTPQGTPKVKVSNSVAGSTPQSKKVKPTPKSKPRQHSPLSHGKN